MVKTQISIRDVDKEIFNEFKSLSIKRRMTLGQALTMAMSEWLEEDQLPRLSLLELKPFKWGKGVEKVSQEIDNIVYGE